MLFCKEAKRKAEVTRKILRILGLDKFLKWQWNEEEEKEVK